MKTKASVLVVVALVAYGLKRHYADASVDALSWILTPTTRLVELVTGVAFTAAAGEGYFSAERMFLIEKACAGVNFMIAAFAMVAFALLYRVRSIRDSVVVLTVSLTAGYLAALIVNAVRIVIAMWLASQHRTFASMTAADLHRLEGIVVYFGGLLLLYEFVRRADRSATWQRFALPLACYYLVTLALPLLNGAARTEAFFRHAPAVLLLPLVLLLILSSIQRLSVSLRHTFGKV